MEATKAPWVKLDASSSTQTPGMQATSAPWLKVDAPSITAPSGAEPTTAPWLGSDAHSSVQAPTSPVLASAAPQAATKAPWAMPPPPSVPLRQPAKPGEMPSVDAAFPMEARWETPPTTVQPPPSAAVTDVTATKPAMPVLSVPKQFKPARKLINSEEDLKKFLASESLQDFIAFLLSLNEAVTGKKISDPCQESEPVLALVSVLDFLSQMVDDIPPAQQSLRYGNPSYRVWFARMAESAHELLRKVVPDPLSAAAAEVTPYLVDSFGNYTRIDYGTGHETTFAALLYCLAKLGVFTDEDRQALVSRVFAKYLTLMRKIQTTYWLEPAGSHGVWGLDDYQFLPFLWGSGQLIAHPMIRPKSIHNPDILLKYGDEYLYLGCIRFVREVKKGPLAETSPLINDISGVPTWAKVNSGMMKMYHAEVLSKFPIMQHFLFSNLLPFEP